MSNDQVEVTAIPVDATIKYPGQPDQHDTRFTYEAVFTDSNAHPEVWGCGHNIDAAIADLYIGLNLHREETEANAAWISEVDSWGNGHPSP